ncbi:hypothetical protein BT69DRAFT_1277038 [Atractiella rhizophila]|nr:hypothetical protein BT69DRAFT_1277038 [Atractiella rhizophila]
MTLNEPILSPSSLSEASASSPQSQNLSKKDTTVAKRKDEPPETPPRPVPRPPSPPHRPSTRP